MGKYEWSDMDLMVNGQPVRVLPEVDFGGDAPDEQVARGISSIEFTMRATSGATLAMAKLVSQFGREFAQFAAELRRWAAGYRFRSRVEGRHSRTRRKRRPTRLQRRRQRQIKNRVKR